MELIDFHSLVHLIGNALSQGLKNLVAFFKHDVYRKKRIPQQYDDCLIENK
jgi:hypothetical protein